MQIRSITPDELGKFTATGPFPSGAEGFLQVLQAEFEAGRSRPEWCFVAEQDDQFIARVVFAGTDGEALMYALYLPWDSPEHTAIGERLVRESWQKLHTDGITHLEAFVNSMRQNVPEQRAFYRHIGLPEVQEKRRFTWKSTTPLPEYSDRLTYRTLAEMGDEAYIEAIRRATDGSFDRLDMIERERLGADAHARTYFQLLREGYLSQPEWWVLAYTPADELAGFVVPIKFTDNTAGTIGYIGVMPEQRGHGYVHDLLAKAAHILANEGGMSTIVADTDQLNAPMIAAFERAGYEHTGTVWVYHAELATLIAANPA